jgi:hypothetical protein
MMTAFISWYLSSTITPGWLTFPWRRPSRLAIRGFHLPRLWALLIWDMSSGFLPLGIA